MSLTLEQLEVLLTRPEDEHLEFKEAKQQFEFERLAKYCSALANEGGGRIVLGVTDSRPRRVVGSRAFDTPERTRQRLMENLRIRVDADEVVHANGRVLVFTVPARPIGFAVQYAGAYWMRRAEALTPMTQEMLRTIFAEGQPDFSAEVCAEATLDALDERAVERLRTMWSLKAKRPELLTLPLERLLEDAELTVDGGVTYAALVLLGAHRALGRYLARAEIVFEYRANEASIAYQQRKEYREGFLLYDDDLWTTINLRNDLHSFQDGLFRHETPAFNEQAVREAILNAVSHRDYRLEGSTFVKQSPVQMKIVSPGGFPAGITADNILERQAPRNRRLADVLARCGLVERSGQGADRMFSAAVSEGKLPPDFSGSDEFQVSVVLHGSVQDESFLRFLERLAGETQQELNLDDLIVLDAVHRGGRIPERLLPRVEALVQLGAVERLARNKLGLARRFYEMIGKRGEYTRRRGLDREASKALLLMHITQAPDGSPLSELNQVVPSLTSVQIQNLLRELKDAGEVHPVGRTRGARWFRSKRS